MKVADWFRNLLRDDKRDSLAEDLTDLDPANPFPEPIQLEITDVFDLHTFQPRDVRRVVEEYLSQAHEKGFRGVRIIHGKGIGVQREMVRSILARTSFVLDWTDAPPQAGGLGATIVRFRSSSQ
jgi:dsDNA-specific endonuclease/ATPase MutS2